MKKFIPSLLIIALITLVLIPLQKFSFIAEGAESRSVPPTSTATISDGSDAVDMVGQYSNDTSPFIPDYGKSGANNGPNALGFYYPRKTVIDSTNHRLFVADTINNRVLGYDLNAGTNTLDDYTADYVLGQSDFITNDSGTSASTLSSPRGLAYDASRDHLFVSDTSNNRILIFDTAAITNGEDAINVLGQADFSGSSSGITATTFSSPMGLTLSGGPNPQYLYVADNSNNRVLEFDINAITDGEAAQTVYGQADFTSAGMGTTQTTMSRPVDVAYAPSLDVIYVADSSNNRVLKFNAGGAAVNGDPATQVLGQADYTSSGTAQISGATGVAYDDTNDDLYVSAGSKNKVLYFADVSLLADGAAETAHLGDGGTSVDANSFSYSEELTVDESNSLLYLSNGTEHRIMIFDISAVTSEEDATSSIGQYNESGTPILTKSGINNSPNSYSFESPSAIAIDGTNNRLFLSDYGSSRVLIFNLNASNNFDNYKADYVLGQADFISGTWPSASNTSIARSKGLAYDSTNNRLFVSDSSLNRVLVYDLSRGIVNNMAASYVLGQSNFTNSGSATSQSGLDTPQQIAYDSASELLYVVDQGNNRVLVFDVDPGSIANGENASYVLGQSDYTSSLPWTTDSNMSSPIGVGYNGVTNVLYVADANNNRVLVYDFDVTPIANGRAADYVLGQDDFVTSASGGPTATEFNTPSSLTIDATYDRLFIGQSNNGGSVLVFDTSSIANGQAAVNILGKANFTTSSSPGDQAQIDNPAGIDYDPVTQQLFVADFDLNRSTVFEAGPSNSSPTGTFNSAVEATDGSGAVTVSIEVDDADDDDTKASLKYESDEDGACDGPWVAATLTGTEATADFDDSLGAPDIDNGSAYQIGSTADTRIITSSGSNTVVFGWDSATDLAAADTTECLLLTISDDSATSRSSTQTLTIDNVDPTASGDLTLSSRTTSSLTFSLGAAGSDTNIDHYEVFYKAGSSGVTESDTSVESILTAGYVEGNTVSISGLASSTAYVANIWTYDAYGNSASAGEISTSTSSPIISSGGISSSSSSPGASNTDTQEDNDSQTENQSENINPTNDQNDVQSEADSQSEIESVSPVRDVLESVVDNTENSDTDGTENTEDATSQEDPNENYVAMDNREVESIIKNYEEKAEKDLSTQTEREESAINKSIREKDADSEVVEEAQKIIEKAVSTDIEKALKKSSNGEIEVKSEGKSIKINSNSKVKIVYEKNKKALKEASENLQEDEVLLVVNEKSNFDNDGLADLYQYEHDIPLFDENPDNDPFTNEDEIFLGLDPTKEDQIPTIARITNIDGQTIGSMPSFRLTGESGETVEVIVISAENGNQQRKVGESTIDSSYKGEVSVKKELEDGKYYAVPRGSKSGVGEAISFNVDSKVDLEVSGLFMISSDNLGNATKHSLMIAAHIFNNFNPDKYIAAEMEKHGIDKDTVIISGKTEPGNIVAVSWKSVILSSVVISDASQGEFQVEVPKKLAQGDHEAIVYVMDERNNVISSVANLLFRK